MVDTRESRDLHGIAVFYRKVYSIEYTVCCSTRIVHFIVCILRGGEEKKRRSQSVKEILLRFLCVLVSARCVSTLVVTRLC